MIETEHSKAQAQEGMILRKATSVDLNAIDRLYRMGFPDEDLTPLVHALSEPQHQVLSLVAATNDGPVGHMMMTPCRVASTTVGVALLGPLVVSPGRQRQGIGGALVRAGLGGMARRGAAMALVLGDPAYYGRFGFAPEHDIATPRPIPPEWRGAWQSLALGSARATIRGTLAPPAPWMDPALWMP